MSLVAYDGSSDSDLSDSEHTTTEKANKTLRTPASTSILDDEIIDSDEEANRESTIGVNNEIQNNIMSVLPKPSSQKNYNEQDELEDIVKPKTAQTSNAPKPPSKKRKIVVDFSALNKDDSDDEDQPKGKIEVTKKSTLLSMLPSARGSGSGQQKLMVPHKVSNKSQKPTAKNISKLSMKKTADSDNEDADDGEIGSSFFSFHDKTTELPATTKFESAFMGPSWAQTKLEEPPLREPTPELEIGPSKPTQNETVNFAYPEVDDLIHTEEMKKIQGKKSSIKDEINFIKVDTDAFIGDARANVMKNLTSDEDLALMDEVSKMKAPSGNAKRKHQITYLAHQAKVRELELKNQWAASKMNRQASRNKYGF
ncbi:DgyrCDS2402 [Dimorphilus gyrociliatus]|uniref:DgyrCDS2402 n=1 Tax=Dimorphilus gyrociliatus TaxID=2664684 RepID=A0A7I8VA68_9ANNE|nr:DgyrCDS2402 [Dimorphilus gyrociliatus]